MTQYLPVSANAFIQEQLDERLKQLEKLFDADALSYRGLLVSGIDNLIRGVIEKKKGSASSKRRLVVALTTEGGYIEVVQRIVETLRYHYDHIEFVVPQHAYSAGTVFVMSGDVIHMDYYSRLGPIDPQVQTDSGEVVPALGYLIQYERLVKKAKEGTITLAEIQFMIEKFDPAQLYKYEQARELSISLLKDWLTQYKFKNWTTTETRGKPVTRAMRLRRSAAIANILNDTERWHTHGYGISMEVLKRDLHLKIDDFGQRKSLNKAIRGYDSLLEDYAEKISAGHVIHVVGDFLPIHIHAQEA